MHPEFHLYNRHFNHLSTYNKRRCDGSPYGKINKKSSPILHKIFLTLPPKHSYYFMNFCTKNPPLFFLRWLHVFILFGYNEGLSCDCDSSYPCSFGTISGAMARIKSRIAFALFRACHISCSSNINSIGYLGCTP